MLQWMGGSRRKVIASTKSTHKRQKQYFEQRKRQQQQQAAGSENHANKRHSCSQRNGNERSLDILSFLNLSTVAQEQKPSCLIGTDSPEKDIFTLNYQNAHQSPAVHHKEAIAADYFETNEARPLSCDLAQTVHPKKTINTTDADRLSVRSPHHKEILSGNGHKLKLVTPCHEISVIDLLGDYGGQSTAEEISVPAQESHVAFSVEERFNDSPIHHVNKLLPYFVHSYNHRWHPTVLVCKTYGDHFSMSGLGKVETETPTNSPSRSFLNSFASVEEGMRQANPSKNFKYDLDKFQSQMDHMVEKIDLYSIDQPFCGEDNIFGNTKPKFSNFRNSLPFTRSGNNLEDVLRDDAIFYDPKDRHDNTWNGSTFLHNHVDNLREDEFCKNQFDLRDDCYAHYLCSNDHWRGDYNFEGSYSQDSSKDNAEYIGITGLHSPCTKHQISGYDFEVSDRQWYSTTGIDHDVKDVMNQPAWSCYTRAQERESLSEESCSSSAVWGHEMRKSPTREQGTRVHGTRGFIQQNKCYEMNVYGNKRTRDNRSLFHHRETIKELGKFKRIPETSPTSACFPTATFESDSFCQTSGMRKRSRSGPRTWSKDVFDTTSDPQLIMDSNAPSKRSTQLPAEHSPISEKLYFCSPSNVCTHQTLPSQNMEFISTAPTLSRNTKGNIDIDANSLGTLSYFGLEKQKLSRDGEKNLDIPSIVESKIELHVDVSDGSKGLSSKIGSSSISPHGTPEMKDSMKGTNSTNLAEDTSSSTTSGSTQLVTQTFYFHGKLNLELRSWRKIRGRKRRTNRKHWKKVVVGPHPVDEGAFSPNA